MAGSSHTELLANVDFHVLNLCRYDELQVCCRPFVQEKGNPTVEKVPTIKNAGSFHGWSQCEFSDHCGSFGSLFILG